MQSKWIKSIAMAALLANAALAHAQLMAVPGAAARSGGADEAGSLAATGPSNSALVGEGALPDAEANPSANMLPKRLDVRSPNAEQLDLSDAQVPARQGARPAALTNALEDTNAFQRLIEQTSGQLLPRFGVEFFRNRDGSHSQAVPVPNDYAMGPGDEVVVRAWGTIDIDFKGVIDRNGQFNLPKIGTLNLAGVKADQLESTIRSAIARLYKGFNLNVTMGRLRSLNIYVVGEVKKPGSYRVSSLSTVLSALVETGGPNAQGSLRHVQLKRKGATVAELDLHAFLAKGDSSADQKLQDGDVVFVPAAQGYVALTGEVEHAAIYELRGEQDTLKDVLATAGGSPVGADPRRVLIERIDAGAVQPLHIEQVALDAKGLSTRLQRGDRISVQAIQAGFANAVTLRGNVSQALRLPFKPGMRITDLIPNKEDLLSKAVVRRYNRLTLNQDQREQQRRRNDQLRDRANNGLPTVGATDPLPIPSLVDQLGDSSDDINWDYALVERTNPDDLTVNLLPFRLGEALAHGGSPENMPLQAGDVVTVFATDDLRVPVARRKVLVRVEGEVNRPGVYQVASGTRLQQVIERAGGLTKDAYLFGAEFYRESAKKSQQQNLDKLVSRLEKDALSLNTKLAANVSTDPTLAAAAQVRLTAAAEANKQSLAKLRELRATGRVSLETQPEDGSAVALPDLSIEAGDKVVLPSRPDFVQVFGAVRTEAALLYKPNRTVGDYLMQAGVSSSADESGIFVARPNGTIATSSQDWFSTIRGVRVAPGDIIVVPEKLDQESAYTVAVRNAKDITQVLGNLLIGAASVKVLRQ